MDGRFEFVLQFITRERERRGGGKGGGVKEKRETEKLRKVGKVY